MIYRTRTVVSLTSTASRRSKFSPDMRTISSVRTMRRMEASVERSRGVLPSESTALSHQKKGEQKRKTKNKCGGKQRRRKGERETKRERERAGMASRQARTTTDKHRKKTKAKRTLVGKGYTKACIHTYTALNGNKRKDHQNEEQQNEGEGGRRRNCCC